MITSERERWEEDDAYDGTPAGSQSTPDPDLSAFMDKPAAHPVKPPKIAKGGGDWGASRAASTHWLTRTCQG